MRTINTIIIHYSDSPDVSADTIRHWHLDRGWTDIGYHKIIRKSGQVEQGRPEGQIGAHCLGHNTGSLGVCLTGSDKEAWYPANEQYSSLQAVLRDWMQRYNIPVANIFLHREKGSTSCPGRFDKGKILALLGQPKPAPEPLHHNRELRQKLKFVVRCGEPGRKDEEAEPVLREMKLNDEQVEAVKHAIRSAPEGHKASAALKELAKI